MDRIDRDILSLLARDGRLSFRELSQQVHLSANAVAERFRRLQAEGTSYADMLTRVRRALAEDYLRGTRMSVDDIAAALAFSDGRSFRQAFARWTGCSPSEFRRAPAPGG